MRSTFLYVRTHITTMIIQTITGTAAFSQLATEWDTLAAQGITNTPFQTASLPGILVAQSASRRQHAPHHHRAPGRQHPHRHRLLICAQWHPPLQRLHRGNRLFRPHRLRPTCRNRLDGRFRNHHPTRFPRTGTLPSFATSPPTHPVALSWLNLRKNRGCRVRKRYLKYAPSFPCLAHLTAIWSKSTASSGAKSTANCAAPLEPMPNWSSLAQTTTWNKLSTIFWNSCKKAPLKRMTGSNPGRRAVFHETARNAMAAGTLQLLFMEVDGTKAATLFNFDYNGRIWVYNSGLDPEAFGQLSLGVVLTAKAIEWAAENGRSNSTSYAATKPTNTALAP